MADRSLLDLFEIVPFAPDAKDRVNNEMYRMKDDMERLLSVWTIEEMRAIFTGPAKFVAQNPELAGETIAEKCRSAIEIGGFTYLTDAIHLADFDMAEKLRVTKVNMLSQMVGREKFFNPNKDQKQETGQARFDDVALFDFLRLPVDMIGQVMQRSTYKDAQNLAITCKAANSIYREHSVSMLLPDITLILDFSSGELNARWWLDKEGGKFDFNPDRILLRNKEHERKKNQILLNTTHLRIETTDDFEAEDIGAVKQYVGNRSFKRVVVKGYVYTENMKMMVELFDKECVEIEVNTLDEEFLEFPEIKTISVRDNLSQELGAKLFEAKHFINISCALNDIDTLRKGLSDWDRGLREIGRWVILKQFTVFQTPFGRRHRSEEAQIKGHLSFISELNSSQMMHGEITEYLFQPTN